MNVNPKIYLVFCGHDRWFCSAHTSRELAEKARDVVQKKRPRAVAYVEERVLYDVHTTRIHDDAP